MSSDLVTITRSELYAQVWSTPMRTLAGNFGLSDVGLAKTCKRFNIPRPPVGYWAKKAAGKASNAIPLPPGENQLIEFQRENEQPKQQYDPQTMDLLRRVEKLPLIQIQQSLRNPHPLVRSTQEELERLDLPWDKRPSSRESDPRPLGIDVWKESRRRALLFFDAVIKAIESIGGKVTVEKEFWRWHTAIYLAGEKITTVRVRERYKLKRTPHKRFHDWTETEHIPTGLLVFDSGPGWDSRIYCQDTEKKRRIEDCVNQVIVAWVHSLGTARIKRAEAAEARQREQEAERLRKEQEAILRKQREELRRKQEDEKSRIAQLRREARRWAEALRLRSFITAIEEAVRHQRAPLDEQKLTNWLTWARTQADDLDPFTHSPPSILRDGSPGYVRTLVNALADHNLVE